MKRSTTRNQALAWCDSKKDSVVVWEISSRKVKYALKGIQGEFSNDGNLILTHSYKSDSTWIWESNTGKL